MRRRIFLGGLAAFIAAPAIVARENIMAIKVVRPLHEWCDFPTSVDRWMVVHPDYAKLLRVGVDHGSPEGDISAMVRGSFNERGELVIGQIDRFTIYESADIVASNYGRGPGLLTEDDRGVRSWTPSPTAREIEAKRADAWRQMRRWLEPRGGRRWV